MKEILHESFLGVAGGGNRGSQFSGSPKRRLCAVARLVGARGIDWTLECATLFSTPVAADRVKFLHRKTERINHRVAGLAGHRAGLEGHLLPGCTLQMQCIGHRHHGLLWRLEHIAQHGACQKNAAMNWRCRTRIRQDAHRVGMRKHAGTPAIVQPYATKRCVGRQVHAVERRKPAVDGHLRIGKEPPKVGASSFRLMPPDGVINEELEAGAEVGSDFWRELRVAGLILDDFRAVFDSQPAEEKIADLRPRAAVVHHSLGLLGDLFDCEEAVLRCGIPKRLVGNRVPKAKRKAGGRGKGNRRSRVGRIGSPARLPE